VPIFGNSRFNLNFQKTLVEIIIFSMLSQLSGGTMLLLGFVLLIYPGDKIMIVYVIRDVNGLTSGLRLKNPHAHH